LGGDILSSSIDIGLEQATPTLRHAPQRSLLKQIYAGRRVVVTGASGTVGTQLVAAFLASDVDAVIAIDNNESELFRLSNIYEADPRFQPYVVDVRDGDHLRRLLRDTDFCFHLAGLKHVMLSERSPFSPVHTNVLGSENVIRAVLDCRVARTLFASSDKAVNPTNVMGASKLLAERLFTAANCFSTERRRQAGESSVFASLRFGNVAGSRGSVIPVFEHQIACGGPVTVTDRRMTRFVISMAQSVEMLLSVMPLAEGGEVFVPKMRVILIEDLAHVMVQLLAPVYGRRAADISIVETRPHPGEKLYEELTTTEEARRTVEFEGYLVVLPPFRADALGGSRIFRGQELPLHEKQYNSANEAAMDREAVRRFLLEPGVLSENLRQRAHEIWFQRCAS
jgi:FlaA1/EpsC-like NDP-sugar epimerase